MDIRKTYGACCDIGHTYDDSEMLLRFNKGDIVHEKLNDETFIRGVITDVREDVGIAEIRTEDDRYRYPKLECLEKVGVL